MTSIIPGPKGSKTTDILLKDILYLKSNVLSFFDSKIYNLYVFVSQGGEERFHLFVYPEPVQMELAYRQLSTALEAASDGEQIIRFSPDLATEAVV